MIYIIGIGLKPTQITEEALEAIKECDSLFLEVYTSKYSEGTIEDLKNKINRKILPLKREQVEHTDLLLSQAEKNNIGLLVYGNPLIATTHIQLLIDAKKQNIKYKVIPGISVIDYLGKTGLSSYRFGKIVSIAQHEKNFEPESFYDQIVENKKNNLHTLCLLDLKEDKLMNTQEALTLLEKIEKKRSINIIRNSTIILMCGLGSKEEIIKPGRFEELKRSGYGVFPQSFVVCAELNEKEKEALKIIYDWKP